MPLKHELTFLIDNKCLFHFKANYIPHDQVVPAGKRTRISLLLKLHIVTDKYL